ncbi:MAG: hypothetical protein H7274_03120 [Rhodoferax sp.]|nr:hypothetical protein [Rhodoferax sp.]
MPAAPGVPNGGRPAASDARQTRGAASATAGNNPAPSPPVDASSAADRPAGDRPRLPPEVFEKLRTMQPEERRAYLAKLREERARRGGGAASAPAY